uniref:Small RNA 2'-O-methyltransferase n=1 Tax=Anthurium amnicola TaxID=1678845 RepID=A0A1D1Y7B4_9ARAE
MFMEAQEMSHVVVRKPPLSAKAILHQKYGEKACYKVEEVVEPVENDCPGLAIPQRGQVLYQCQLELPGCSVTSDKFTKKKDAEQSAAKMALEKLGIQCVSKDLTPEEALDELIMRISSLFTDKFLSAIHPMVSHFRAAIEREGDSFGMVPVSIIAACDVKVNNLCKVINPKAESEPLVAVSLVLKAARLSDSVRIDDQGLSIGKIGPYSSDSRQSLIDHPMCTNDILVEALYIPSSIEKAIETFNLKVSPGLYYMDEISQRLGVKDSSYILVSRTIGKASSETRFYFSFPRFPLSSPDSSPVSHLEEDINFRASHLSGQNICGGAVLATVGYTWKSRDLFYEDVSICTYYRPIRTVYRRAAL